MNDTAAPRAAPPSAHRWLAYRSLLVETFHQHPGWLARLNYLVPGGLPNPVTRDNAYLCSRTTHGWRRRIIASVALLAFGGTAFLACVGLLLSGASPAALAGLVVAIGGLVGSGAVLLVRGLPLREAALHGAHRYVLNVVRHRDDAESGAGMTLLAKQLELWPREVVALHARAARLTRKDIRERDDRKQAWTCKQKDLVQKYEKRGFTVVAGDRSKRPLMVRPVVTGTRS